MQTPFSNQERRFVFKKQRNNLIKQRNNLIKQRNISIKQRNNFLKQRVIFEFLKFMKWDSVLSFTVMLNNNLIKRRTNIHSLCRLYTINHCFCCFKYVKDWIWYTDCYLFFFFFSLADLMHKRFIPKTLFFLRAIGMR